MILKSRN